MKLLDLFIWHREPPKIEAVTTVQVPQEVAVIRNGALQLPTLSFFEEPRNIVKEFSDRLNAIEFDLSIFEFLQKSSLLLETNQSPYADWSVYQRNNQFCREEDSWLKGLAESYFQSQISLAKNKLIFLFEEAHKNGMENGPMHTDENHSLRRELLFAFISYDANSKFIELIRDFKYSGLYEEHLEKAFSILVSREKFSDALELDKGYKLDLPRSVIAPIFDNSVRKNKPKTCQFILDHYLTKFGREILSEDYLIDMAQYNRCSEMFIFLYKYCMSATSEFGEPLIDDFRDMYAIVSVERYNDEDHFPNFDENLSLLLFRNDNLDCFNFLFDEVKIVISENFINNIHNRTSLSMDVIVAYEEAVARHMLKRRLEELVVDDVVKVRKAKI